MDVIKRKQRGEEVHVAAEPEAEETPDLMEALRASIEARSGARRKAAAPHRKAPARKGRRRSPSRRH
jgi:non-homologous end joining protein Ku